MVTLADTSGLVDDLLALVVLACTVHGRLPRRRPAVACGKALPLPLPPESMDLVYRSSCGEQS